MVGKVVVTCEVSIYGLGTHPASEKSGPITTQVHAEAAGLPKRATNGASQKSASQNGHAPQNRAAAQDAEVLRARIEALSDQVRFSLSHSVLMTVAKADTPDKVAANSVEAVTRKLEDTFRGAERLRAAIAIVGQARYSELCQELNFANDHLDNIPDRDALRKAVDTLEAEAVRKTANVSSTSVAGADQASFAIRSPAWHNELLIMFDIVRHNKIETRSFGNFR